MWYLQAIFVWKKLHHFHRHFGPAGNAPWKSNCRDICQWLEFSWCWMTLWIHKHTQLLFLFFWGKKGKLHDTLVCWSYYFYTYKLVKLQIHVYKVQEFPSFSKSICQYRNQVEQSLITPAGDAWTVQTGYDVHPLPWKSSSRPSLFLQPFK